MYVSILLSSIWQATFKLDTTEVAVLEFTIALLIQNQDNLCSVIIHLNKSYPINSKTCNPEGLLAKIVTGFALSNTAL